MINTLYLLFAGLLLVFIVYFALSPKWTQCPGSAWEQIGGLVSETRQGLGRRDRIDLK